MKYSYMITLLIVSTFSSFPAYAGNESDIKLENYTAELKTDSDLEIAVKAEIEEPLNEEKKVLKKTKFCSIKNLGIMFLLATTGASIIPDAFTLSARGDMANALSPITAIPYEYNEQGVLTPPHISVTPGCRYLEYEGVGAPGCVEGSCECLSNSTCYCMLKYCGENKDGTYEEINNSIQKYQKICTTLFMAPVFSITGKLITMLGGLAALSAR